MKHFSLLLFLSAILFVLPGCKRDRSPILNHPRNIRGVLSYQRDFPDLNDAHLSAANAFGIQPIRGYEEAEGMKDQLEHIVDNEFYSVDSLTHSVPYLVKGAARLLDSIGSNFLDSLKSKGLNPNKIIVTSVLRTMDDVERLMLKNRNAIKDSPHSFGTTFDVSWKRFEKIEDKDNRFVENVGADTLKMVLSEVLRDLRLNHRCYVKYERKQGCFHITSRIPNS